ncbi:hypothetical protein ACFWDG_23750, partial [Peribacillus sp. NPDC060186]
VAPTIRVTVPRKKQDTDEDHFNEIILSIKKDGILEQGNMIVEYISTDGIPLEEDEWRKTF